MKSYFNLQLLQRTGFCLLLILLILPTILYVQFIWQVFEYLVNTVNSSVNQADDYLGAFRN